jgi:exosortase F-associated protein
VDKAKYKVIRLIGIIILLLSLVFSYLARNVNYVSFLGDIATNGSYAGNANTTVFAFVLNKLLRFCWNELTMIGVIHLLFQNESFTKFSILVMGVGFFILLPLFFLFWFWLGSHPITSMLHRLTLNPLLLMLLVPAFYYQNELSKESR